MFCVYKIGRIAVVWVIFVFVVQQFAAAQCTGGTTNRGVITPTLLTWQTTAANVISGDYFTFTATANTPYTFTFCMGGGTANYNTHLTILDAATGLIAYRWNDDNCAAGRSMITNFYTATGGTYRVLIRRTGCATPVGGDAATLAYRQESPLPTTGNSCSNPYVIPSLPFTLTASTCSFGNDYNNTHACLSNWMNGEDFVFQFTTAATRCINITTSGMYTFSGLFILNGCPNAGGTTCLTKYESGGAPQPFITGYTLPAGTYYIVLDKMNLPDCSPFTINISDCPAVGGNTCANAAVIPSLPYVLTGLTTAGFGNDYDHLDECVSDYMRGEDFVFRYDAPSAQCIDIWVRGSNPYTGIHVFDACPDPGVAACLEYRGEIGGNPRIRNLTLPSAGDYYFIVDTWAPSTPSTPFSIEVRQCVDFCTFNPDGANACGSATVLAYPADSFCGTTLPAPTYTVDASPSLTSTFCGSIENNQWFRFTADNDTMSFTITTSNCTYGDGIQAMVLQTSDCINFTSMSNCFNPGTSTSGTITCTTLTVGQTYYFMVDGWAEDDCDFTVGVNRPATPLPVEWLYFDATSREARVNLRWATATEVNNKGFYIERGVRYTHPREKEAYRWTTVGFTPGTNSRDVSNYEFTDAPPYTEETYLYRLRQVDIDGSTSHSEMREVRPEVPTGNTVLKTYPNPVNDQVTIEMAVAEAGDAQLLLLDISGAVVMNKTISLEPGIQPIIVDLQHLPSGIYAYRINMGGVAYPGKLTVMHN